MLTHVTYWTMEINIAPPYGWTWFESSLDSDQNYLEAFYQTSARALMHKSLLTLPKAYTWQGHQVHKH